MERIFKKQKGNITILVLVMALVIILGIASMVGFVFRDIGFTRIDQGNLRALNFAEAGVADFQYRIMRYLNYGEALPPSGYTEYINGPDGQEGRFTVTYEELFENGTLKSYEIISSGTDKSNWQRTVKVNFSIGGSASFNIYDYIYSARSMNNGDLMASQTSIIGPFFTNGHLNLRGSVSFIDGPLYVKESIKLGGSSAIGEPDNPIELFLGGSLSELDGEPIDPYNPGGASVYVSSYSPNVPELPMLVIDQSYVDSLENVLKIEGSLEAKDTDFYYEYGDSYIQYDSKDKILSMNGNILVEGNLILGSDKGAPNVIHYQGSAKIITTGNITVFYQLVSHPDSAFPSESLLILMSMNDIYLDFKKSLGKPEGEFVAIAANEMLLDENTVIRGSLIADHLIADNNSRIYYVQELSDYWPEDMPDSSATMPDSAILESWQEIKNP